MEARTNNIRKATAYQRESAGRSASERLLDQHYKKSHGRIAELERELKITSQPAKKAKVEVPSDQAPPSTAEVLARITKHFGSDSKLLKSLELLGKLFASEAFAEISTVELLEALLQLVEITASRGCETRVYQNIKQVFTEADERISEEISSKKRLLSTKESELWAVVKAFGLELSGLWSDDGFEFSRTVSLLKKFATDFETDFDALNKLEALLQLKQETQDVVKTEDAEIPEPTVGRRTKKLIEAPSSEILLLKRTLLFKTVCRLFPLAGMGWRKSSLDPFLRDFNAESKERLLNRQQKAEFAGLYQQHLNSKIKGSFNEQLQFRIDREILSTPLNSHHEIVDNRREFLTGDAADRWSNRQH